MRYKHQEVRRNHKNECEQNNNSVFCYDNSTVALYYEVKLSRNDNIYLYKVERSRSFLKQFASIILSLFGIPSTCRKFDGTSINFPALSLSGATTSCLSDYAILFSNNENDKYLTFDNFNISQTPSITRVTNYPTILHTFFADRCELVISDAYLYSSNDTQLYAIALRVKVGTWQGVAINSYFLIAKDVFDPPLELLSNSRVDLSYKIVIAV